MDAIYRFGIEEEYFLADATTRGTSRRNVTAFHAAAHARLPAVERELLQSQVELSTPPSTSFAEARETLGGLRASLSEVGRDNGVLDLVACPRPRRDGEPLHILVDSTGLKLCGAGEWLIEKHGTKTRRTWRKLHLGLDAVTGQIVAAALTTKEMDDGAQTGALLNQVVGPVASFTADGAYDQEGACAAVAERHPEAAIIVPPRSTAVPSEAAETAPTQRDRHLQFIAKHGRAAWQKASGYTKRARAEAAIGRFKQVIGGGLRSRTDGRRATEVDVAVHALNRMLELGRPISVRIA